MKLSRLISLTVTLGMTFCMESSATVENPDRSPLASGFFENAQGSPIVELINQADSTLDMEIYEMDDPKVINAIHDAISRGVVVRIVKEGEPVGSNCDLFSSSSQNPREARSQAASCAEQRKLVNKVNSSGGSYVAFAKNELCKDGDGKNCLEHGKLLVADSEVALISTGNFNTTNLCDLDYSPTTCNRDFSFVTREEGVVDVFENIIRKDVLGRKYDVNAAIASEADKVTVGPYSLDPLISFIDSAKKSIQLENQYLKDPTLNEALTRAARRGVNVQVVIASACSFGRPKPNEAKRLEKIFSEFDQAGISTRMFTRNIRINGRSGYLHAKAIVIDGRNAWIGSVNGSTQALTRNREFGIFFNEAIEVRKLVSVLDHDFSDPNTETWQESLRCAEKSVEN